MSEEGIEHFTFDPPQEIDPGWYIAGLDNGCPFISPAADHDEARDAARLARIASRPAQAFYFSRPVTVKTLSVGDRGRVGGGRTQNADPPHA